MSVLDNGGFIGRTADYSDNSFYEYFPDINYDTAINSVSGGAPDFRWTLDATTNEEGSLSTTPTGTFSYTTGLIQTISDQSADMSGSEYLTIANDPLINGGTGYVWTKRSISFWFNADTTGSGTYPCIWEEGGGVNWISIYFDNGLIYANIGESSSTGGHATASVSTGTTYHCLVTFDLTLGSNNIKIYLNGSLAGQATSSVGTDLLEHTGDIRIGSGAARNHLNDNITYASYDGRLQDVCYWNEVALTATDASDIYNAGIIVIGNKKNTGLWSLDAQYLSKNSLDNIVTLSYITTVYDIADLTSHTFSDVNLGDDDEQDTIIICVGGESVTQGINPTISSLTVNGIAANPIVNSTTGFSWFSGIWYVKNISSLTGTIVTTGNTTVRRIGVSIYRISNTRGVVPTVIDTDLSVVTTLNTSSVSTSSSKNDITLMSLYHDADASNPTTSLTVDNTLTQIEGAGNGTFIVGSKKSSENESITTTTVTADEHVIVQAVLRFVG